LKAYHTAHTLENPGRRVFAIALATLSGLYLLQTVTPLRLDHDVVRYFRIAMSLADGLAPPNEGFPVGYPAILAALVRTGLGSSFFIVLANCVFLGVGLRAFWYFTQGRPDIDRQCAVLLTMLAIPVIRSIAMPLAEPAYFGLSLLALASMTAAIGPRRPRQALHLLLAAALIALAVSVRLVGVALIPALILSCFLFARERVAAHPSRRLILLAVAGSVVLTIGVCVGVAGKVAMLEYVRVATERYSAGALVGHVASRLQFTMLGLGELAVNLPTTRFFFLMPYLPWLGAAFAPPLVVGLREKLQLTPIKVYVASYVAILIVWPHYSTRLWMPILPLLLFHAVVTVRAFVKGPTSLWLVRAYLAFFTLGGIAALAYTTRISLSGDRFPTVYGKAGGMVTPGYEAENPRYNADAVEIFRRFDSRHKH